MTGTTVHAETAEYPQTTVKGTLTSSKKYIYIPTEIYLSFELFLFVFCFPFVFPLHEKFLGLFILFIYFIQLANDIKMKTKHKQEVCWAAGEHKKHKRALSPEGAVLPTQQNSTKNNNKRKVTCSQPKMIQLQKVTKIKHHFPWNMFSASIWKWICLRWVMHPL